MSCYQPSRNMFWFYLSKSGRKIKSSTSQMLISHIELTVGTGQCDHRSGDSWAKCSLEYVQAGLFWMGRQGERGDSGVITLQFRRRVREIVVPSSEHAELVPQKDLHHLWVSLFGWRGQRRNEGVVTTNRVCPLRAPNGEQAMSPLHEARPTHLKSPGNDA